MTARPPRPVAARPIVAMLTLGVALCSCNRRPPPPVQNPTAHYTVGTAWRGSNGVWFYPKEQADYQATGLAIVSDADASGSTADGERRDASALSAAHQTLQLPCIVRVTDLENGRSLLVRVNDRGPDSPARLIALSPRAAALLGIRQGQPAQVEVVLDSQRSQDVAGGNASIAKAAPVEAVTEQSLDAPAPVAAVREADHPDGAADRSAGGDLPQHADQGLSRPGQLWIDGGRFGQRGYAEQTAAEMGGAVQVEGAGRQAVYTVRSGPFRQVDAADAALDRARHSGVTGARIIVE